MRLGCIVSMRRMMEKVRRWLRKEGSIRLLCEMILTTRMRRISRTTMEVGKMYSNKKCNGCIGLPCCIR